MRQFNLELRSHWASYTVLILGLGMLALVFILAWPERFWLRASGLALALFYFSWGWWNHAHHGKVPGKVLAEYGGIGLLGVTLLWLITL